MKHFVAAGIVALITTVAVGQEVKHAPTVEQCRADQKYGWRSWKSQRTVALTKDVSYLELSQWGHEMSDCREVDPENGLRYYNTETEAAYSSLVRL